MLPIDVCMVVSTFNHSHQGILEGGHSNSSDVFGETLLSSTPSVYLVTIPEPELMLTMQHLYFLVCLLYADIKGNRRIY